MFRLFSCSAICALIDLMGNNCILTKEEIQKSTKIVWSYSWFKHSRFRIYSFSGSIRIRRIWFAKPHVAGSNPARRTSNLFTIKGFKIHFFRLLSSSYPFVTKLWLVFYTEHQELSSCVLEKDGHILGSSQNSCDLKVPEPAYDKSIWSSAILYKLIRKRSEKESKRLE